MTVGSAPAAFTAAQIAFDRLWRARPGALRQFTFAGRPATGRVVGQTLAEHTFRPFEHLRDKEPAQASPALLFDLWDEVETGVPLPAGEAGEAPQATWQVGGGRLDTFGEGRFVRYTRPGSTTWLDRGTGRMVGARHSGDELAVDERSKPLPLLLFMWHFDGGAHVVHAGLVTAGGRGALIGGASGSGKTTTCLSCLRGGLGYLGDDHVALQRSPQGAFVGHSLFSCARVEPHHLERFRELEPYAIPSDSLTEDKHLILLEQVWPERLLRSAEVRVVLLPRITGAERTTVSPASKSQALMRLAPSTLTMPFSPGAGGFERLGELVRSVPCLWLELGRDVEGIPACVEQVLAESA